MNSKIKNISKACSVNDEIFSLIVKNLRDKTLKTELDIDKFIRKETRKRKLKNSFPPVVAIGKNAAEIHHKANNSKLKKGFLVIDFGVKYKEYCSDCTRTLYLGKPNKAEIKLYNLVLEAQLTALNHVQPGVYAADIDLIARAVLQDYWKNFIHGTGHGVGLKIHQAPNLKPRGKLFLKNNQAITIEPGLYFKRKLGIRIEDTIIVKNNPEILTKITKKLITI